MFVAMPLSGIGMPSWSIILRNKSRSSAMSIESMLVPRILSPSSERARAMFSGEIIWAFPHIYVRSGYILGAITFASLVTRLLKRSLAPKNIGQGQPASLRPKGSLSPLKGTIATKATSCQVAGGLTRIQLDIFFWIY